MIGWVKNIIMRWVTQGDNQDITTLVDNIITELSPDERTARGKRRRIMVLETYWELLITENIAGFAHTVGPRWYRQCYKGNQLLGGKTDYRSILKDRETINTRYRARWVETERSGVKRNKTSARNKVHSVLWEIYCICFLSDVLLLILLINHAFVAPFIYGNVPTCSHFVGEITMFSTCLWRYHLLLIMTFLFFIFSPTGAGYQYLLCFCSTSCRSPSAMASSVLVMWL